MVKESSDIGVPAVKGAAWNYHPKLPLTEGAPFFCWPLRPIAALKFFVSWAFFGSIVLPYGTLAAITWFFFQPAIERCAEFRADWILEIFGRNLLLLIVVVTFFHLYLHKLKLQGNERKFDARELATNSKKFFLGDQVWDNVFYTVVSGVTIWTAYEVIFFWAYANELLPFFLNWRDHPFLFVAWFFMIPFWSAVHFYFIHRLLHWKPLYRLVHSVHHRNDNLGPWSGFSMHPIEQVMYLSSVLIHVLLSHPLHIVFHMQWLAIGANVSHSGFEAVTFRGKPIIYLQSFYHTLHHRYYDCNYGNNLVPLDKLFGTYHDGTEKSWTEVKRRRQMRSAGAASQA